MEKVKERLQNIVPGAASQSDYERFESENVDSSDLGKPLTLEFSGKVAPSRFLKSAMTERLSSWDPKKLEARGVASQELINVYRHWGEGGFGIIVTGNTMIEYDQLEAAGNPIIPRDAPFSGLRFERWSELARQAKAQGSLCVVQLSHPGRQCSNDIQSDPVSASDIQLEAKLGLMSFNKPHAATQEEIQRIIEGFAHAAEYSEKAGFDGVQLHGAHGYLLAQFLAESTNKRTDQYGGSLVNRSRIIVEIAEAIRKRVKPNFVIGIKMNSVEFQEGGFPPEDAAKLAQLLEENRFDFIELSGGTYESFGFHHKRDSTRARESFFIEFAEQITPKLTKTRSFVTGGFRTAGAMQKALKVVDGVGLARAVCQEPNLPKDIIQGKVIGGIRPLLDTEDFGATNVAAGTQIRQMGRDQQPINLGRKDSIAAFKKDMGAWREKMMNNSDRSQYGYVDLISQEANPYTGTF